MRSLIVFVAVIIILITISTELYLSYIGLGNPIRYDSSLIYGYAPTENQKRVRLANSVVTINDVGLRSLSDWKQSDKKKILFIGDSITYGGSYIDDKEIFSSLVCDKLKNYICGNAGVNAYSVINMVLRLRYDVRIKDANIIVITVAPGDFYREYADSNTAHFFLNDNDVLFPAISEAISFLATKYDINKYLSKKNNTEKYNHKNELIEFSIKLLKEEIENQSKFKKIYLLYSIEKNDKNSEKEINKYIKSILYENLSNYLIDLTNTLSDDKLFYDGVHYNKNGHSIVSQKIVEIIRANF